MVGAVGGCQDAVWVEKQRLDQLFLNRKKFEDVRTRPGNGRGGLV